MQLHFSSFLMLSHAKESTGDSVCGNSGDNGHFGVSCLLLISHSFGVCVCFNKSYETSVHSTMHIELIDSENPPPLQFGVNERCICS